MTTVHVRIFYPADPMGVVPGGIDTFLRGLIKWAPPDLEFSLVGMTTDPQARPAGRWTQCRLGERNFKFFPVVTVGNAGGRSRVPLSVRFSFGTWWHRAALYSGFDVFDFHRPEPSLLFMSDQRPKNAYFHNDPSTIESTHSDNLWKRLPAVYKTIERLAFESFASAWCVRESGVQTLRERFPLQAQNIHFIPTWVDADVFNCVDDDARQVLRHRASQTFQLDEQSQWIVTVGRLDTQKDPMLMLAAFARLRAQGRHVVWLVVGDGVLRADLMRDVATAGLTAFVHFVGLRPPAEIADLLRAADVYALSSAYEGMPMALLEALGCGLPAAVTDVGEVRRVVLPGVNGAIANSRSEDAFAVALADVLDHANQWRGAPTQAAVEAYQPGKVLIQAYANYRALGEAYAHVRTGVQARPTVDLPARPRCLVVGVPIDVLDPTAVSARLMSWASAQESRTVCFCNVHSVVAARFDERHRLALLSADLAAPDGAPVAWTLRKKGNPTQQRVDGPGTMWRLCGEAQTSGIKIGLYGSSEQTLATLTTRLRAAFPKLEIAYAHSPPFRDLTAAEDVAVCGDISRAGVGLLFVGLGCPKQEYWLATHCGRIPAVMLGVGAAFDFHAGIFARAPNWMSEYGLEWLHRLMSNPRRLWRRYLFSNSIFLTMSAWEALCHVARRLQIIHTPDIQKDHDYKP